MNKLFRLVTLSLTILLGHIAYAQSVTVTGNVTDDNGEPVPGAAVLVKGASTGTITDVEGAYSLEVPSQQSVLVVSFVGYMTQELEVGARSQINVQLQPDATQLSEVIVTALGIERDKKSLGYFAQEVEGAELIQARETNFLNNLSGKVAGVEINKTANGPGGSTGVLIRGGGGFVSGTGVRNQALFVVDGIPIDNYQTADSNNEYGATDRGNGAQHINPDDIESVTVLKGPEAAALYGSRGLSGVIQITTKKGKARNGLGISYSGNFTFENPLVLPDLQNEYAQGLNGAYDVSSQGSWGPKITGQSVTDWTGESNPLTADSDDLKNFLRTGSNFTHSVDVTGGNETTTFRLGVTNVDSKGMLPNSGLKRNMLTLRSSAKLTEKFSADVKLSYVNEKVENRPEVSGSPSNIFAQYITRPRNIQFDHLSPEVDKDGNQVLWLPTAYSTLRNPHWVLNQDRNEDVNDRLFSMVKLDYRFTDWLKAFVRHGADFRSSQDEDIKAYGIKNPAPGGEVNFGSGYTANQTRVTETNIDFLVTASKTFSDFNVSLNFGGNRRHNTFFTAGGSTGVLDLPGVYNLGSGSFNRPVSEKAERRINSLYGFANISFRDYLFLDLTYRNDWSSTLNDGNQSFSYPSASLSFVLSDAVSLPDVISFAKVRASSSQGASDLDPYLLFPTYTIERGFLDVISTSTPTVLLDENIKPEFVKSNELGLDLKLFENRLGLEVAYFSKNITDQILELPRPGATGYAFQQINAGKVSIQGFEFALTGSPIKTSEFQWDVTVNYGQNRNEIVELIDGVERLFLQSDESSRAIRVVADEGELVGDIYGRDFERDDNGNILVDDNGIPIKGLEKNTFLGNTQQKFTMGLNNRFNYKGITFGFLIDWKEGGSFYSQSNAYTHNAGTAAGTIANREGGLIVEGVQASDGAANTVAINAQQYWDAVAGAEPVASQFIYDATSIRLREAFISYTLPQDMVSKIPYINRVSVGVTGRNLWLIKSDVPGIDPETSFSISNARGWENGAFPSSKVYGFNINLGF